MRGTKKKSEPKKQHYVPQVYLEHFAVKKSEHDFIIQVYSKSQQKAYVREIGDVAEEHHFYTIEKAKDKYAWETFYSKKVEPMMGSLWRRIRSKCENALVMDGAIVLTNDDRRELALSITYQLLRGKQARLWQKQKFSELLPSVIEQVKDKFPSRADSIDQHAIAIHNDPSYFKSVAIDVNTDPQRIALYANELLSHAFVVYRINGNAMFITSDNPVMFVDSITHNAVPFTNGMTEPSTLIYYPISPKLMLCLYHPQFYFHALSAMNNRLRILDAAKESTFIQSCNRMQQRQCYDSTFALSREPLMLVNS